MPTAEVDIVQRLNTARQRVEEVSRENSRLTGELDSQRKRLNEEAAKCQKDFECGINELPNIIGSFKTESENALARAEVTLGLKEATETPVEVQPQPVSPAKAPIRKVRMPSRKDEDGLI